MKLDPRQIEKAMKQLGVKQEPIEAKEVIIRKESGEIRIANPTVVKVNMMGQETYQITGEVSESSISEEDVQMVMEQSGATMEDARKALEETGDIAQAIMKLDKES